MPGYLYLPYEIEPFPTTHVSHTYPEMGHHLHHFPLTYIAHNIHTKFHDKDEDVHVPKADIRETLQNFHLEVELPGIKEHTELKLRWTSDTTLMLTSKITRPEIPKEELVENPVVPPVDAATPAPETNTQANGEAPVATTQGDEHPTNDQPATAVEMKREGPAASSPKEHEPHLTLHERLIGPMGRAFAFPVPIDRDGTHAKLEAGVLRIVVPKLKHVASAEEQEKHFLHVPIRIFGGHDKPGNPVHPCS